MLALDKNSKKEWVQWVVRRVEIIRNLSEFKSWYWVDSAHNPADIPTKEISVFQFIDNGLWWKGSNFLNEDGNGNWPE